MVELPHISLKDIPRVKAAKTTLEKFHIEKKVSLNMLLRQIELRKKELNFQAPTTDQSYSTSSYSSCSSGNFFSRNHVSSSIKKESLVDDIDGNSEIESKKT